MGCCLSKKPSSVPLSGSTSCDVNKSPDDPVKPNVNKPVIEPPVKAVTELRENPVVEEAAKPNKSEKVQEEEEEEEEEEKDVLVISHERSKKKTESEVASASASIAVVRSSSCTKEEVDAILIQCGKLSRSNSAAARTRRYSGSKRSFDLEEEEEEAAAGRKTPQRNRAERVNGSPRERRRRTPSRERERGGGSGSRRVSRSPAAKRSEPTNPSGSLVNSSNRKFVTVPATDKKTNNNNNGEACKRVPTVKRSIGEACRTAAAMSNVQPPPPPPSRKAEQSPYRRTPLGEIDQNATKGDKKKKMMMIKREAADKKPQGISRSRSLRKSRDFDLLQTSEEDKVTTSSYTALLLKDIENFNGKSNEDPFSLLPSCVTKACSIVEAVEDLNSTTKTTSSDLKNHFRFTSSSTVKKADLMEPSFEKYVTVKRGCSLEEQEFSNNIT